MLEIKALARLVPSECVTERLSQASPLAAGGFPGHGEASLILRLHLPHVILPVCPCVRVQITLLLCDLILTDYICNDPSSRQGHTV